HPLVDLLLGLLLLVAVALLQAAGEFLALAVDDVHVVVSELAPLLTQLAFGLGPVAFDLIPVHRGSSTFMIGETGGRAPPAWRDNARIRDAVPGDFRRCKAIMAGLAARP